jgi:hypothetical protein
LVIASQIAWALAFMLALAWVLAQGDDIVPIPGTKRRRYLDENIGALDVHLAPDELADHLAGRSGCRLTLFRGGHAGDQSVNVAACSTAFPSDSLKSSAL